MKIGLVCAEYPPRPHGGIGTFYRVYAQALAEAGHEVTVFEPGMEEARLPEKGIAFVSVPTPRRVGSLSPLLERWRLRQAIINAFRAGRIEVVEAPDYGGLLPFRLPLPTVIRLHNSVCNLARSEGRKPSWGIRWAESRTLRLHPDWIGVSRFVIQYTQETFGLSPRRSCVIYNPTPPVPHVLPPLPDGIPEEYVLFAGSVRKAKGAVALAEAARLFLPGRPGLHVVFAGPEDQIDGVPAPRRLREVVGSDLADRLVFLGRQEHSIVLTLMKHARVLCAPSEFEAFGLVAVEAMAMGCPVIYTKRCSGPEVIEDGVTGLLVEPDRPEEIAAAVGVVLDDVACCEPGAEMMPEHASVHSSVLECLKSSLLTYTMCRG